MAKNAFDHEFSNAQVVDAMAEPEVLVIGRYFVERTRNHYLARANRSEESRREPLFFDFIQSNEDYQKLINLDTAGFRQLLLMIFNALERLDLMFPAPPTSRNDVRSLFVDLDPAELRLLRTMVIPGIQRRRFKVLSRGDNA